MEFQQSQMLFLTFWEDGVGMTDGMTVPGLVEKPKIFTKKALPKWWVIRLGEFFRKFSNQFQETWRFGVVTVK